GGGLRPPAGRSVPARDDVRALATGQATRGLPLRPAGRDAGLRAVVDLRYRRAVTPAGRRAGRLRVAFFGAGWIVPKHLAALDRLDRTELVGIMSRTLEHAAATTKGRGTPTYTDMGRLLDEQRPDIVYVCTPPHRTPETCDLLIGRG